MYAFKGDRIYVQDEHADTKRDAVVISGDYTDGRPPYWVRWADSGEESLLFPTTHVDVEHTGPQYPAEYDTRTFAAVSA
jgi:hypothetical protein